MSSSFLLKGSRHFNIDKAHIPIQDNETQFQEPQAWRKLYLSVQRRIFFLSAEILHVFSHA